MFCFISFFSFTVTPLSLLFFSQNYPVNIVPGQHSNKRVVWKYLYVQFLTELLSGFGLKAVCASDKKKLVLLQKENTLMLQSIGTSRVPHLEKL